DDELLVLVDVLVEVELLVLELLVVGVGQVQSLWQMSAPSGLATNTPTALPQVGLPGGSHSSPGSSTPLPHSCTVLEVDTVVVVVVPTWQLPQQSCCGRTLPPSARQCRAELSTSHFGAMGQSRKLVQKPDEPTQREWRRSQAANRGSAHTTSSPRPQIDSA